MTVVGQTAVNYAYDNMNRLTQITQGSSIVSFTYDDASRRDTLTLPNGVLVDYDYDNASRVTKITYKKGATVLGDLTYTYDKAGNRTQTGGSFARTGIPQPLASATFDAANRQTNHTYDNNGNLVSDGTNTYTWNARNQLSTISGGVTASFVYDGLGRREKKTVNSSLTEFLYDRWNPVQETSGATVLANILTGLGIDEFLTRTDVPAATTSHFLPDALGSAVALADSAGAVQTEYTYEPFGKTASTGPANTNPFQYTGRENDGTGLYYYRARYYHPGLQRFLSEDPIEFYGGDINLYAYVWNDPLNYIDPYGLFVGFAGTEIMIGGRIGAHIKTSAGQPKFNTPRPGTQTPVKGQAARPPTKQASPTDPKQPGNQVGDSLPAPPEGPHAPFCLNPGSCGGGIVPPTPPGGGTPPGDGGGGRKDPPPPPPPGPGCPYPLCI